MAQEHSVPKKLLDTCLQTLLSAIDVPKCIKVPATFVAELSARFGDLTAKQQAALSHVSDADLADALTQLDLTAYNAAFTAAGIHRIEDQIASIRAAVEEAQSPTIIKFPGTHVEQNVSGDGNIVVGTGSVHVGKIDMRRATKRSSQPVIPGTVATEPYKVGYLKYLAKRFNEFKDWEVGRDAMNFARIYKDYERAMKFSIANTPLELFQDAVEYFQRRIRNSKLGRMKAREGNRLFETFEEFLSRSSQTTATS